MPIVSDSVRTGAKRKGGRVDLERLLEHTEHHPNGRVQIDPATGRIRSPKNNVLFTKKLKVKLEGQVISEKEVKVNGGHVKKEGSVWRIPLNGPARFHWKVMMDDHNYRISGRLSRSAPVLERAEMEEYQFFRVFLAETGYQLEEFKWDEADAAFYDWLSKPEQDRKALMKRLLPLALAPNLVPVTQAAR